MADTSDTRDAELQALLRGLLPPDAYAEGELIIQPLAQAIDGLCLCVEPHWWTTLPCPGPAPDGTPIDSVIAAALSRALYAHTDPNTTLVEEVADDEGAAVQTATKATFLLDPHDFAFYRATLGRALQRYAANPRQEN